MKSPMDHSSDDDDLISPLSGAESLIVKNLEQSSNSQPNFRRQTQNSASGRIRKSGSFHTAQTRGSNVSIDEFMSCVTNASDIDSLDSYENSCNSHPAVCPSRICIETNDGNKENSNNIMATKVKKTVKKGTIVPNKDVPIKEMPKVTKAPVVTPGVSVEKKKVDAADTPAVSTEKMNVDAAEVVYCKTKEILSWSKSIPVVSFFVGTSEAVASKALGVVGTDLSKVDGKIENELSKLDSGILNPAIEAIAKLLLGVAGKSEEAIRPIIGIILKPIGMLIKSEANEQSPEAHTETPEVTVAK